MLTVEDYFSFFLFSFRLRPFMLFVLYSYSSVPCYL